MKEKLKDDKFVKDLLYKFLSVLIIAVAALLLLNVMSQSKDGRSQIIDEDGGTEYWEDGSASTLEERKLEEILSSIKGVGDVSVMLTYEEGQATGDFLSPGEETRENVKGAIITASGGADAVIKSKILEAVTALFNIPVQNVKVYERESQSSQTGN